MRHNTSVKHINGGNAEYRCEFKIHKKEWSVVSKEERINQGVANNNNNNNNKNNTRILHEIGKLYLKYYGGSVNLSEGKTQGIDVKAYNLRFYN